MPVRSPAVGSSPSIPPKHVSLPSVVRELEVHAEVLQKQLYELTCRIDDYIGQEPAISGDAVKCAVPNSLLDHLVCLSNSLGIISANLQHLTGRIAPMDPSV